ncbi:hypothetical protein LCM10_05340 [Rossellomorea aquimaris]|uniref:hypothetical protein n=1 Tax=Rossellomorea aquimaris TaxID=189382 RepID=UPI001CD5A909|nr:hypothetical protein [Rossellomorea aquimaris]MCA1054403.1 hypothetical protein [Rossellomorea aquimaris]
MLKRFFLGIKIILIAAGFFLAATDHSKGAWLILGSFWLITGIETAIRTYHKEGKLPLGFSIVFVVATTALLTLAIM